MPLTKINLHTLMMEFWSPLLSLQVFPWCLLSTLVPVSGICGFLIRQQGHRHLDKYFIHARSILYKSHQGNSLYARTGLTFCVMIHPNFSHPCRIPSLSPYPCLSNHCHWTHHPYQTYHRYRPVNHPNHRHPLISPQLSPSSPSHGTSIIRNTPQWRCTKSHPQ